MPGVDGEPEPQELRRGAGDGEEEEEEDYMGDLSLFLPSSELPTTTSNTKKAQAVQLDRKSKRPKSLSWQEQRRIERERKQKAEDDMTKSNMETQIPSSNLGFKMLKMMGYSPGSALGKEGKGVVDPVGLDISLSSCLHSSQGKPQNLSFQKKNGRSIDDRNDGICGSSMAVAATAAAVFLDYSNRSAGIRGDDVLCQNRGFGMSISARKKKKMAPLMVASTSIYTSKKTADSSGGKLTIVNDRDDRRYKLPLISPETLDEWMMESVVEIMKNIKQAPFLIHVFSNEEKSSKSSPSSLRLQTEPVQSRAWDSIKNRWTERRCSVPDGIILVEELRDSEEETETKRVDHSEFHSQSQAQPRSSNTRTWGLLVQGRGAVDCSACYILNTCRVLSSVGASTHFNLIRASCFGETAEAQLRNSWLQKR